MAFREGINKQGASQAKGKREQPVRGWLSIRIAGFHDFADRHMKRRQTDVGVSIPIGVRETGEVKWSGTNSLVYLSEIKEVKQMETGLYCVCIFHQDDSVTPIIHDVCHAVAKSIARHYNRIIAKEITDPYDDTYCMTFSQDYCTNWRDFI